MHKKILQGTKMQINSTKDIDNKATALNTIGELFDELKSAIQSNSSKSKVKANVPVAEKQSQI